MHIDRWPQLGRAVPKVHLFSGLMALLAIGAVLFALELRSPIENTTDIVIVYKTRECQCCTKWVDHLKESGFSVTVHDKPSLLPVKHRLGVPDAMASCHTATIGGYVLEGHVPASDIRRMLEERPVARGLAVPGMPIGSPGMEQGDLVEPYQTLLFDKEGKTRIYTEHGGPSGREVDLNGTAPSPPA